MGRPPRLVCEDAGDVLEDAVRSNGGCDMTAAAADAAASISMASRLRNISSLSSTGWNWEAAAAGVWTSESEELQTVRRISVLDGLGGGLASGEEERLVAVVSGVRNGGGVVASGGARVSGRMEGKEAERVNAAGRWGLGGNVDGIAGVESERVSAAGRWGPEGNVDGIAGVETVGAGVEATGGEDVDGTSGSSSGELLMAGGEREAGVESGL